MDRGSSGGTRIYHETTWGNTMKIAIAHDYLLQHGGAERVVATWANHLPSSAIHSLAYDRDQTFDVFDDRAVQSRIRAGFVKSNIQYLLPILPTLAGQVHVKNADVSLVSTSGWAHQFRFDMPTLAYVHSPARWLYASDDYSTKLGRFGKLGLAVSRAFLHRRDVPAMNKMSSLVSNSKVTQDRILSAYGVEAPIVHPPVEAIDAVASAPALTLPDEFTVVVSRNRGYKNVKLALDASARAGMQCVVVGNGTEEYDNPSAGVFGLGRVSDPELKWVYQNASVLIGSAREDFGLTVLEANLEGTPVAAIPAGGYLETVAPGENGALAASDSFIDLAEAIVGASAIPSESCRKWAQRFSPEKHMNQLIEIMKTL